jgi:glyoxylase-like metal-dependent hydrolase (beta-lactamase superfamily II)|tara:strand:- start:117 stop:605 length:489 start_codon:yes stop_codon:yes gene_type:complete
MINKIKENIFQFCFKEFGSCVYFLKLDKNILIDTGSKANESELSEDLNELDLKTEDVDIIILTHSHYDHNGNVDLFSNAKIYDNENISELDNKFRFKIIKTPGHTKDSICLLYEDILFSGDTIFHEGGRGRTDLPGGSEEEILDSIKRLEDINYKILCPGHV